MNACTFGRDDPTMNQEANPPASLSIEAQAFKGASWLALFKVISQSFSWIITILVARLLVPGDYGLMEMSTLITGYASMFHQLGLGAAIIQRPTITQDELSSIFWFNIGLSSTLAAFCFVAAYPTASIFNEPRVVPLTQTVSLLFLLTGPQIVPWSLMQRQLRFKETGFIEMCGVFVSCCSMWGIASFGGGVWTLIGGYLVREFTKLILVYAKVSWFPTFHFSFQQAKTYLRFGIPVALGSSLYYVYDKSDMFFAGRAWPAKLLGYYSFALQLAKIPTDKIVALINQVAFPVFSRLQNEPVKFNRFYLNIVRINATLVMPIFVGGFLVGEELVRILLNEKWYPLIPLFRYLCLAQIVTSLSATNDSVHTTQGRPHWTLAFNATMATVMPISFIIAVRFGMNAIIIPWLTTYVLICALWATVTIRKVGITPTTYFRNLFPTVMATAAMSFGVLLTTKLWQIERLSHQHGLVILSSKVAIGGLCYLGYLWFFDRTIFEDFRRLKRG